jgi:thiamine-phosphate pyrophosphorylase
VDSAVATSGSRRLKPLADCRLYAFVDTAYLGDRDPRQVTRELCAGGADIIQLRAKRESLATIRAIAEVVSPITRTAGVWLVINDHVGLAAELGAPACHLGQEDFLASGAGKVDVLAPASPNLRFGLSTHSPEQAIRAITAGAHYVAVGPVFATPTKPSAQAVTLDYVRWAADNIRIPWFAIGGITLENVDSVLAAGARRICVVSAILNSADVAAACRAFRERVGN